MALSYDDMMFECILDNTSKTKITQKKSNRKMRSNNTKIKDNDKIKYYNNDIKDIVDYETIRKLYSNYEHINKYFLIVREFINEAKKLDYESKKNFLDFNGSYIALFGPYFEIIYLLPQIIINGDNGYNYFIKNITEKYNFFIKDEKNIFSSNKKNVEQIINFYEHNIIKNENNEISIKINNNYNLLKLTNDNMLTRHSIKVIDILNRYFKHLSSTYEINKIGFYIINEHKSIFNYQKLTRVKSTTNIEIKNLINNINNYRSLNLNEYDIKYQVDNEIEDIEDKKKINENNLINLNYIITYGKQFTLDSNNFINYINTKLIFGGNVILFLYDDVPIMSKIVRILSSYFKKIIITKATIDPAERWVFIGKGYNGQKIINKITKNHKIDNFINNSFNTYCNKLNSYLNSFNEIINFNNLDLVREINKKYVEIYKWAINNNIDIINIFSDSGKEPKLINDEKIVNYLFPNQKGVNKSDIKLFNVSVYSVTPPNEAKKISDVIKNIFNGFFKYNINQMHNLSITDGTANVGGNTINFSDNFNKVNTIEINQNVFDILKHNCKNVYKRKNIFFYQGDCIKIIPNIKQDIIFIDPPWDGMLYKAYNKLHLYLSDIDIIDIVKEWYGKKLAKLYIIKCPANLDFEPFIANYSQIFIQKLKNYNIIYIISTI